jgi:hypothetical protein
LQNHGGVYPMKLAFNILKFEDARQQVIEFLNENNEFAGQFDFASANISYFVDVMAYISLVTGYSISHIANNIFLDTTEIRKSAVSKSKQIGYTPKRPYSAKFRGKLIYKGVNFNESNSLTIYPRSPFVGSFGNLYFNNEPIILRYNGNPTQLEGEYTLSEGVFRYYKTSATGQSNFSFTINNRNIDEENLSLFVIPMEEADNPDNGLISPPYALNKFLQYKWSMVKTFKEIIQNNIFYVEEDIQNEGAMKIIFGNGVFGAIPSEYETIFVEYFETKGSDANNENLISLPPVDTVEGTDNVYLYYGISDLGTENIHRFSVDNFDVSYQNTYNKSFGGSDLEGLDDIKANAPRFYSSVGRAATKNDYIYVLNNFPGVGSVNVIGGPDLFPNDLSKLGYIYISVVPNINPLEFMYNNNIYISPTLENEIRNKLNDYSILSTTRHFYKPSYIMIDVIPYIELMQNLSVAETTKIKNQVKQIIVDYFASRYNKLGIPFRESKVSVNVDSLDYILSSFVGLNFKFVINNNTVENLIDGMNNIMYLPTKKMKDAEGNVTGTTNFIKTNTQVVEEDLYPSVDWSILDKKFSTITNPLDIARYKSTLKLLNNYMVNMKHSDCSIYSEGGLIHPTLSRFVYNRDFVDTKILDTWFETGLTTKVYYKTYKYIDYTLKEIFKFRMGSRLIGQSYSTTLKTESRRASPLHRCS